MAELSSITEASRVPDCLTIEETGRLLRIGRTAAYKLARLWRDTGGKMGIPNIAFGSSYRVPTAALEAMLGRRITHIPDPERPRVSVLRAAADKDSSRDEPRHARRLRPVEAQIHSTKGGRDGQGSLPI